MTKPDEPKRGPGRPKKQISAQDYLELQRSLSPEAKADLAQLGIPVIQGGVAPSDGEVTKAIWGIRCQNCGNVGAEILGDSFGPNGEYSTPVAGTRLRSLVCVQTRCTGKVDKAKPFNPSSPNCQYCGSGLPLSQSGGILPFDPANGLFGLVKLEPEVCGQCLSDWVPDSGECHRCGSENMVTMSHQERIERLYSPKARSRIKRQINALGGDLQGTSQSFEGKNETFSQTASRMDQEGAQVAEEGASPLEWSRGEAAPVGQGNVNRAALAGAVEAAAAEAGKTITTSRGT